MTIGIYKLSFTGTNQVYIGQSQNIEYRYSQHLSYLKRGRNSKKLQIAYIKYGIPNMEVIVECSLEDLDSLENGAIEVYDSFNNGLNSLEEAGYMPILVGENHPGAKYSNEQIAAAFILLVNTELTHQQVADKTGISKNMVNHIAAGTCHVWLQQEFPEEFAMLASRKPKAGTSSERGVIHPKIMSPEGNVYTVDNIRAFGREHSLPYSSLVYFITGQRKNMRGWSIIIE